MSIAETDATSANLRPGDDLLEIYRRTGAADDFERVVTRYAPLVYGECRRVTRDAHDAEDAAQLAFLALAIEIRSGSEIRRPAGWLQRVARRQALKIVRSRGRRRRREEAARRHEALPTGDQAIDPTQADATAALIREAMDALPEKHRLPLVLHYFGGLSLEAIARELGLSRTAVGTRLHRARKLLGAKLGERGVRFDAGELANVIASLVPAAVIASLARGARGATAATAVSGSAATFATSIGQMLTVAANVSGARPIAAATATILFLAASTGMAWVGPGGVVDAIHSRSLNFRKLFESLFDFRPSFQFRTSQLVIGFEEKAERSSTMSVASNAAASPTFSATTDGLFQRDPTGGMLATTWAGESLPQSVAFASSTLGSGEQPMAAGAPWRSTAPPTAHTAGVAAPTGTTKVTTSSLWRTSAFASADAASAASPNARPSPADTSAPDAVIGGVDHPTLDVAAGDDVGFSTLTVDSAARTSRGGGGGGGGGSAGSVQQTGGRLAANRLVVGDRGTGRYDLVGGRIEAGRVTLGAQAGSHGILHIGGGELRVTDRSGPLTVGDHGSGQLILGTADAPGRVTSAGGPIIVRSNADADGSIEGWGEIHSHGPLINNGRIIADGHGKSRSLDLSKVGSVTNTIDNKPDGTNGYYARNGGSVVLPPIAVAAGTGTYTWGESASDPKIDLVNSFRMIIHNQPSTTDLSVALQSTAGEQAAITMPSGLSVVSLWSFTSFGFNPQSLAIEVRYDHNAIRAQNSSEFATHIVAYEAGSWQAATNLLVDTNDHIVSGSFGTTFDGSISYIAVGIYAQRAGGAGGLTTFKAPSRLPIMSPQAAITPEPVSLLSVGVGIALFATRRRRPIIADA